MAETRVTLKDFVIPNTGLIPEEVRAKVKKWSDYIDYCAVDWNFQNDAFMQGWVNRCFGRTVAIEDESIRSHLRRMELQEGIAKYLARKISELTVEKRAIEFERADFKLSDTKPFQWRRNLPPLQLNHTIFNYVATYNDFERRFAQFLDEAPEVLRFASLGTTEQGDQFRVDYLKPSGAIGFYHPDWIVVQKTKAGEVNWIIETKGRVWEGTEAKDEAIRSWCERITEQTGTLWDFRRVNQIDFDWSKYKALAEVLGEEERKGLV